MVVPSLARCDDVASVRYLEGNGQSQITAKGGATISTPFAIASLGKTITSVAVLRLVDAGYIDLDEPARDYLPTDIIRGLGGLAGVSVRHLLTMTSGLPDYLSDDYIAEVMSDPDAFQDPHAALSFAYGEPVRFRPGADFEYSNTNFVLAGIIAARATGRSYASIIDTEDFRPAGMLGAFVYGSRALPVNFPSGHEGGRKYRDYYENAGFGDGGLIASAQDVANFYRALFADGVLLSPAMMAELMHDPVGDGYGMGLDIDGEIVGHSGGDLGFSSDVRFNTETGMLAVILIAQGDADTDWASDMVAGQ